MSKPSLKAFLSGAASVFAMLGVAHAQLPASLDVQGLTIGSAFSEAKAKMLEINPKFEINEYKTSDGNIVGYMGIEKKDGKTKNAMEVIAAQGKVASVQQSIFLAPGEEITTESFDSAVFDKFGQRPSYSNVSGNLIHSYQWNFNRDGKLGTDPSMYCGIGMSKNMVTHLYNQKDRLSGKCGTRIHADATLNKIGLVNRYTTSIYAEHLQYDEALAIREKAKVEAEGERNKAMQNAKENKVKL